MSFKQLATGTTLLGLALVLIVAISIQPNLHPHDAMILIPLLFGLYAFTEFFPLKRDQFSISLLLCVDLVLFVKFGLVALVFTSQIVHLFSRWYRQRKFEFWKTLANNGMFLVVNGGSAATFYLLGGTHHDKMSVNLFPLFGYCAAHFLVNHFCLYLYFRQLDGTYSFQAHLNRTKFDIFSTLFAASLGFLVIMLYEGDGLYGLIAFGMPMVLCVYVFKLFNDVWRSNALFRNLAALTGDFSGELEVEALFTRVTEELPKWFERVHCAIFLRQGEMLVPISHSTGCDAHNLHLLHRYLARHEESLLTESMLTKSLGEDPAFAGSMYNLLAVAPFRSSRDDYGFCCLLAQKSNEFDATTLDAVSILANQLSVSYHNAMRYENVEKQSLYDELTQLPNHRYGEKRLSEEIQRLDGQAPLSLLLIDLDHFKKINDTYGHVAGNKVLQTVSRTFEAVLGAHDFVARYGGEEFIAVLPGSDSARALEVGEQIRAHVGALQIPVPTMEGDLVTIQLTVSIGIATCPDDAADGLQLLRFADRAMYVGAKRAGRNRVALYSEEKESATRPREGSPA
ncbi:sensor domain-containing diguanylate cyclase [Tumebacillus permanentifrigoris]|uniref:Diguanylate cyclase with GAF sensor n=1 Tax=Tumebacillus permanentifrigoris TaxID=378543 RepID=A0A316DD90_9BACL|nr:GGDEF domain-containing protein [Tumebacillus permanentifrigoris]PWK15658.1 diguanylate cyclase with GAF sensor [Tumebacillus permanentifrigoris]